MKENPQFVEEKKTEFKEELVQLAFMSHSLPALKVLCQCCILVLATKVDNLTSNCNLWHGFMC